MPMISHRHMEPAIQCVQTAANTMEAIVAGALALSSGMLNKAWVFARFEEEWLSMLSLVVGD